MKHHEDPVVELFNKGFSWIGKLIMYGVAIGVIIGSVVGLIVWAVFK